MTVSKAQMSAWDREYFDHMDSLIDELTERQWLETQAELYAARCLTERDGFICMALQHGGDRHLFVKAGRYARDGVLAGKGDE